MIKPVYIEDIIGQIVANVQTKILATIQANETAALGATRINTIFFMYGPGAELVETLAQMDKSQNAFDKKYPLVWLVTDITEKRGRLAGIFAQESLQLFICHQTDQNYKAAERAAKVFKPVLDPIYYSFIEQVAKYPLINQGPEDMIVHDRTKHYFLGNKDNTKNKLNDYVDAIEIDNLGISIDYQPCV